MNQFKH